MVVIEGTLDSAYYFNVLDQALIANAIQRFGDVWTFVQDNASVHSSHYTKSWLVAKDVHVLYWPAKSPDLYIIENLWKAIARKIYAHGLQYSNVGDLSVSIQIAWDNISNMCIKTLYVSISQLLV